MGQAKRRGTFEERKKEAEEALNKERALQAPRQSNSNSKASTLLVMMGIIAMANKDMLL